MPKTKFKTASAPASMADLADRYLTCRSNGHSFQHDTDWKLTTNSRGLLIEFTRMSTCPVCTTWKEETIAVPSFVVVAKKMHYPPGYLLAGSGGRAHRSEAWIEILSRQGVKLSRRHLRVA